MNSCLTPGKLSFLPMLSLHSAHLCRCLSPNQSRQLSEHSPLLPTRFWRQDRGGHTENKALLRVNLVAYHQKKDRNRDGHTREI